MKLAMGFFCAVIFAGCANSKKINSNETLRDPASLGGYNYNVGSYVCENSDDGLSSSFTFGARQALFSIKGEEKSLECYKFQDMGYEQQALLKSTYKSVSHACTGLTSKGDLLVGMSNSMGIVQMHAFLFDRGLKVKAKSMMNCKSAPPKKESGW